jgi:hypothetical protein
VGSRNDGPLVGIAMAEEEKGERHVRVCADTVRRAARSSGTDRRQTAEQRPRPEQLPGAAVPRIARLSAWKGPAATQQPPHYTKRGRTDICSGDARSRAVRHTLVSRASSTPLVHCERAASPGQQPEATTHRGSGIGERFANAGPMEPIATSLLRIAFIQWGLSGDSCAVRVSDLISSVICSLWLRHSSP